jgi:hypothetical protein
LFAGGEGVADVVGHVGGVDGIALFQLDTSN